jgi:hypothetical protein
MDQLERLPRKISLAAIAAAVLLLICIGARSFASWKYWGDLDHNSPGTWLCMAMDARDGVLYRPVESNLGYGGTRYAPLFPVLIAAFMRAGTSAVAGGFSVGLIATAIAISGLFLLMRKLGTPAAIAAVLAIFALAATCTRTIILGIKGDLLPVGLTLWGLAALPLFSPLPVLPERARVRADPEIGKTPGRAKSNLALIFAAICFALALAAKITSVFGIAASAIWLLIQRKFRQTAILCIAWLVAIIAAAIITQWASHGQAKTIFLLSASGGGSLTRMLQGPHLLIRDALQQDRILVVTWLLAFGTIAATRQWLSLPSIYLLIATVGTILIYGSPGTHINHFVDMYAAAVLVIGALAWQARHLRLPVAIITLLLILYAAQNSLRQIGAIRGNDIKEQMQAALADAAKSPIDGPILAEDPLLPILADQRPYMLDPFMFRAIRARRPKIADRFWQDLANRRFKAVILHKSPSDPSFSADDNDFGPGFIEHLEETYALSSVHGDFYVMLPKS